MSISVYVATSFATRERVHAFMAKLRERVPDARLAYDWTGHTQADGAGDVACRELDAIDCAGVFVALLPGGPGTWSEIGYVMGRDHLPIILVGSVLDAHGWRECPIAHVCKYAVDTEEEAIEIIAAGVRG